MKISRIALTAVVVAGMLGVFGSTLASDTPTEGAKLTADKLGWMGGKWVGAMGGGGEIEEHWMAPKDGLLLGMSRMTAGGKLRIAEMMSVETDAEGTVSLRMIHFGAGLVTRKDAPPMTWKLIEQTDTRAVFEDATRDFPKRIVYYVEGDTLRCDLEGTRKGEPAKEQFAMKAMK